MAKNAQIGGEPSQIESRSGGDYIPDPTAHFCLNFLSRDWFGAKLKGTEALTFATLLLSLHVVQKRGLLMSKKDAMRAIGVEHVSTMRRYIELAVGLGYLKLITAASDARVDLLVLTEAGSRAIEKELATVRGMMDWVEAMQSDPYNFEKAQSLSVHLSIEPPNLDELTLIGDRFGGPSRSPANPHSYRRWINAYSETLRALPRNIEALHSRAQDYADLGMLDEALTDYDKLVVLQPGSFLSARGEIHLRKKQFDAAILDFDRHLEMQPDDFHALERRAEAYAATREWKRALTDVDVAIPLRAKYTSTVAIPYELLALRGTLRAHVGKFEDALSDLKAAKKIAQSNLGEIKEVLSNPGLGHLAFATEEQREQAEAEIVRLDIAIASAREHMSKSKKRGG